MKLFYPLITLIALTFSSNLSAQNHIIQCGTIEDSPINAEVRSSQSRMSAGIRHTMSPSQVIPDTIHVIVHVLWSTSAMNIPDSMIMKQLTMLNEDFQRTNADAVNTPAAFQPLAGSLPVVFALAYRDTSGQPTTGIDRVQTTHGPFGFNTYFDMTHSANGGADKWNTHFLNLYCAEMSGLDGVGWMGSNICLISYLSFGVTRTGTHEMGHVFGLTHIWGVDQAGGYICSSDDGITDTPVQWSPVNYCGPFPLYDSCTVAGDGIMYMNYMNYNFDNCINMFSVGQVNAMRDQLNGLSNDLINNVQLGVDDNILMQYVSIYPNPGNGNFKITIPENLSAEINIYNAFGQMVSDLGSFTNDNREIELQLNSGIYFCAIKNNNSTITKKIIVQ